jgi:hypothetical protein
VYVVFRDWNYEGYESPEDVFGTKKAMEKVYPGIQDDSHCVDDGTAVYSRMKVK